MKNAAVASILLALVAPAGAAPVDPALKSFLADFAKALHRGDFDAAAEMSHFPLQNEVHQQGATVARAKFKSNFAFLKGDDFAECFKATAPEPAGKASRRLGDWALDCNGNVLYFKSFVGKWRFSGYENVNE